MTRILLLLSLGCAPRAQAPPTGVPASVEAPVEAPVEASVEASAVPSVEAPSVDRCASARAGEPCSGDGEPCVLDWGVPGGYSSALWCMDGKWVLEQETNLPE